MFLLLSNNLSIVIKLLLIFSILLFIVSKVIDSVISNLPTHNLSKSDIQPIVPSFLAISEHKLLIYVPFEQLTLNTISLLSLSIFSKFMSYISIVLG